MLATAISAVAEVMCTTSAAALAVGVEVVLFTWDSEPPGMPSFVVLSRFFLRRLEGRASPSFCSPPRAGPPFNDAGDAATATAGCDECSAAACASSDERRCLWLLSFRFRRRDTSVDSMLLDRVRHTCSASVTKCHSGHMAVRPINAAIQRQAVYHAHTILAPKRKGRIAMQRHDSR